MKLIKLVIAFATLAICSACVSFPDTAAFDLPENAKVGYDITLTEEIGHTHYGTTIFNNINKANPEMQWGLTEFAKNEAVRLLKRYSFEPVEIGEVISIEDKKKMEELDGVRLTEENRAIFEAIEKNNLDTLKSDYGVSAVISMKSFPGVVAMECSNYGCTEFRAEYPGFYSRGLVLLPPFLHAVLPSITSAQVLEPNTAIHTYSGAYAIAQPQLLHIKGFKPSNFKSMSADEWAHVKEKLYELITRNLENYIKALKAGADGNGGYVREVN